MAIVEFAIGAAAEIGGGLIAKAFNGAPHLLHALRPPLSAKERLFCEQIKDDLAWAPFGSRRKTKERLGQIRQLATVVAGDEAIDRLDDFVKDRVPPHDSLGIDELKRTGRDVGDNIGEMHVACSPSSPSSIAMLDLASEYCPSLSYSIGHVDESTLVQNILDLRPEIAILANARYYSTSQNLLRLEYANYAPIHPSIDVIFLKAPAGETSPTLRRLFIIPETSGLEPQRMRTSIPGIRRLRDLEAITPEEVADELQYGDGVYVWQTYFRHLASREFRPMKINPHETWFSVFLRRDLARTARGSRVARYALIRLLEGTWSRIGNPEQLLLSRPRLRRRIANEWCG
ncbi:MAG TPA: hypothetical protein VGG29_06330 [Caulobacteraceae bacterium]|jgi:hypothetical protein